MMPSMAVAYRDGMDFCGDLVDFTLELGGKSIEEAKEFCQFMWDGPVKGDLAVLKDGLYYVCDGVDPDSGSAFSEQQLAEIKAHFGDDAVIFL